MKDLRLTVLVLSCALGLGCTPGERPASPNASVETAPEASSAALIAIGNAKLPLDGVLVGGQPTPEQLEEAARQGYRTIINLRTDTEEGFEWEAAKAAELGLKYVQIPIDGAAGLTRENARLLAEAMADAEPMMIHCRSGNRVGALLALKAAWLDGATADEAMQLGKSAGLTKLEAATRERLETP